MTLMPAVGSRRHEISPEAKLYLQLTEIVVLWASMPHPQDAKKNLLQHSEAKVRLLRTYVQNYLSVIANSGRFNRIRIFDIFCGPGVYENEGEGSPLVIRREIKKLYETRSQKGLSVPQIDCYFSDQNKEHVSSTASAIEQQNLMMPAIGTCDCDRWEFEDRISQLINEPTRPANERTFIFIDPYGYSSIRASDIKARLHKKFEVLLFLPSSFMYRFEANGTPDALKRFISDFADFEKWETSKIVGAFIEQLRVAFKNYI